MKRLSIYRPKTQTLRAFNNRGMGSSDLSEILEVFGEDLEDFRSLLLGLYIEKSTILTKRETLRFKLYGTITSSIRRDFRKFESLVLEQNDPTLIHYVTQFIVQFVHDTLKLIPFLTTKSERVSPMRLFNQDCDFPVYDSSGPGNFKDGEIYRMLTSALASELLFKPRDSMKTDSPLVLETLGNHLPYNIRFFKDYFPTLALNKTKNYFLGVLENKQFYIPSERPAVAELLESLFNASGLPETITEAGSTYYSLMLETQKLLFNYNAIVALESEVTEYIHEYISLDLQTTSIMVSELLAELQALAQISLSQQIISTEIPAQDNSPSETPVTDAITSELVSEASNKKTLTYAAIAAAAAGFLLIS